MIQFQQAQYQQTSSQQLSKNILKIDLRIVNVDISNNLQNLLRNKFTLIAQKADRIQQSRQIKKYLTYINNRELRPIDIVLRMNPYPEVAFMGWHVPYISKQKNTLSPSALRTIVLNDNNMVRYRKAYLSQRLRNSVNILVGNIADILRGAIDAGLDIKIEIGKKTVRLDNEDQAIEYLNNSKISNEFEYKEVESIELEFPQDLDKFLQGNEFCDIDKLQISNMVFNGVIDVREDGSDFIFDEHSILYTFTKIWNIESKYFDVCQQADMNETKLISLMLPILVILPKEILHMMINQMQLEGMSAVYGYGTVEDAIAHKAEFADKKFAAVLCLQEQVPNIKLISNTDNSVFINIDSMVDKDIWEKFKRLEFDITDSKEFDIFTTNLQQSLEEINVDIDPQLRPYIPSEFNEFLKSNFSLICNVVQGIVQGKLYNGLPENLTQLGKKEANLRKEFQTKYSELELSKNAEYELMRPVISEIKRDMTTIKKLKDQIDSIYNQSEKADLDTQSNLPEIERFKSRLNVIAEKQFVLAQALGNHIVSSLRQNKDVFMNTKATREVEIPDRKRRVFNFTDDEWDLYTGREIFFITRNINIAKLLVTLFKTEDIPQKEFIKLKLPSPGNFKADWVFYDRSVNPSELNNIQTSGLALFDSGNINEMLARTEVQKKELLDQINKLEGTYVEQEKKVKERYDMLDRISRENDQLIDKVRSMSRAYGQSLQKYRVISQLFISFNIFYKEVFRKLNNIQSIIKRLEIISQQYDEREINESKLMMGASKQIMALAEILTKFYFSLAFLRFTTRVLNTLPKISNILIDRVARNEIILNKLKNKLPARMQNCLFISSNDFAAERALENVLSMAMLQFRITRDHFKVVDTTRYKNYLNQTLGFIAIALNGDGDQLERLANIIKDIELVCPNVPIFAMCQYSSSIITDFEVMRDKKLLSNIYYIKRRAFLTDTSNLQPDNRLHITSLYLYSMS